MARDTIDAAVRSDPGGGFLGDAAVAHQRRIRDQLTVEDPRPRAASLDGYQVEAISRADATPIINRYEWLGTIGSATLFVGLFSPGRELQGVSCFGHGPTGNIRRRIGSPALCLERGACVHYAPKNAASYLINRACKLLARTAGVETFFAYGDPQAHEYGGVYQAAGWLYLGQGIDGQRDRNFRQMVLAPGLDPKIEANWKTTRELRRAGREHHTFATARLAGWRIEPRAAKHVYATNVGRERKQWAASIGARPYPAPRPHLKRGVTMQEETP